MTRLCKDLPEVESLTQLRKGDWVLMAEAVNYLGLTTEDGVRAQVRNGRLIAMKLNKGLVIHWPSLKEYKRRRDRGDFRGGGRPCKVR